jgi:hypothetical protein
VLPKFSKVEFCKHFKTKRLSVFAVKLDGLPSQMAVDLEEEIS